MVFEAKSIRTFAQPKPYFPLILYICDRTDLDDDTRIVRAGRTGKAEDDVVFYMVRDKSLYD